MEQKIKELKQMIKECEDVLADPNTGDFMKACYQFNLDNLQYCLELYEKASLN
jgi:hypothetical protein